MFHYRKYSTLSVYGTEFVACESLQGVCSLLALWVSDCLQQYKTGKRDEQEGPNQCFLPFVSHVYNQMPMFLGLVHLSEKAVLRAAALTALLTCAQVATHPAAPASAQRPLIVCSAGHRRTYCSLTSPWKELYTAFACLTAKPNSMWIAQESANVSRGWEQLLKAFSTGLRWILGIQGILYDVWFLTCFEFLCLPGNSLECLNSVTFRMAFTSAFEGKYTLRIICDWRILVLFF